jgi:chromosomal replication initiation ATPase DnaA
MIRSILLGVDSYIRNVAQDIRDIQAITQHNEVLLVEVRKAQTDQASSTEQQAVLDWLSRSDHAVVQSDNFNRRHQGTWLWFLESATFTEWLGTSSKTLLCLGIPGVGKTILMSTVVHHLQERYRSDASVKLAYMYLDYGRQVEQSLEQLLASLLQQACQLESRLLDTVKSLYDHHKEHKMRPSVDELTAALQSVMASHSRVFILIDALDECRTADGCQSTFLKILANIQHNSATSIFLTSRIAPDDMREFRNVKSVDICANGNDMREYLNGQMFRLPRVVRQNPELQEQIGTEILGASDGL